MLFDDLWHTSPKSMIMLGSTAFDLAKVQRFHKYDKRKDYCIFVRFEDGDEITIHYESVAERDGGFKALRHAYCLFTDAEKAAREAELKAERERKAAEEAKTPKKTLFGTIYPDTASVSQLDTITDITDSLVDKVAEKLKKRD